MRFCSIVILIIVSCLSAASQEPAFDRVFFENSAMSGNYFYSSATYTNPSWIENAGGKLPVSDSISFTPGNALRLHYVSGAKGKWEAKLLFKEIRGQDHFSPADRLTFWLLVQTKTATKELPAVSIGGKKSRSTSVALAYYVKEENVKPSAWIRVAIPLKKFGWGDSAIQQIESVFFSQHARDGKEHTMFIDQVELAAADERNSAPASPTLRAARGYEKHVDITWEPVKDSTIRYIKVYRSSDGGPFQPVGIQSPFISRYSDFTGTTGKEYVYKVSVLDGNYNESGFSNTVKASTKPMTDEELLEMVQEAHFRYYWEGAEPNSGLSLENIHGRRNMIATGASGFGMMTLLVGAERKFITRDELVGRFEKIVSFLEKCDRFHGAYPHFIDGTTGKTEPFFGKRDNGADLVETSFLFQGLLAAREYFDSSVTKEKSVIDRIDRLWREVEWDWFRKDPNSKFLLWHWSPDQGWVINHKLIGWNETLITYFLAIGSPTHSVPASLYYSGWASQSPEARDYRKGWGQTSHGSMYKNGNTYYGIPLKVGVSNGGPLFFVHYSFLGLDPRKFTDAYTNYFDNNTNIAKINYRYCVENPEKHKGYGPDGWGLTASDGLWSYQADEPVPRQDHGKLTPTGALASFPYTPDESMAALKNYYRNYGSFAWGEYGFYDAFNLDENWRSEIFMGLNQGPVAVMIENYRSGLLWRLFMKNRDVQEGLRKIANENP
jgi:hypothetical protein